MPDFLGIGAAKCGTTWLWKMLKGHREIWLPPRKELHYFDRSTKYRSPVHMSDDKFLQRLLGFKKSSARFRANLFQDLALWTLRCNWPNLRWALKYYCSTYSDQWYPTLFNGHDDKVTGEFTPAYSFLDDEDVDRVQAICPEAKILFLIRNPIERDWSQLRFEWTRRGDADMEDVDALIARSNEPGIRLRGDYLATLDRWESRFGKANVFVGFYDDISDHPENLLRDVSEFLGIDPDGFDTSMLARRVNVSKSQAMPPALQAHLHRIHRKDLEVLCDRLGGHACRWLEQCADRTEDPVDHSKGVKTPNDVGSAHDVE